MFCSGEYQIATTVYRIEGNFGGGKLWRIHYKSIFGEIKFGEFVPFYVICEIIATGACLPHLLHKNLAIANIARPVHATHSMHIDTS